MLFIHLLQLSSSPMVFIQDATRRGYKPELRINRNPQRLASVLIGAKESRKRKQPKGRDDPEI